MMAGAHAEGFAPAKDEAADAGDPLSQLQVRPPHRAPRYSCMLGMRPIVFHAGMICMIQLNMARPCVPVCSDSNMPAANSHSCKGPLSGPDLRYGPLDVHE